MPEFIPLAIRLRGPQPEPPVPDPRAAAVLEPIAPAPIDPVFEIVGGELQLLKLAAREAYERAVERALTIFADDVLARELECAPAAVAALAQRALDDFAAEDPIALVVSPADGARMPDAFAVRIDAALSPGDLLVDVRDGTIDARFCIRRTLAIAAALDTGT